MADRPAHLPSGTPLGAHYTVEGLVRLAEGRMFYLANDVRPDLPTRFCWHCGHGKTPRESAECQKCGEAFEDQRFLISARWDQPNFDAYERFYRKNLQHPGLACPLDVFRRDNVLFSVIPYRGEGLMIDEAAPLPNKRVLELGQRILGTLAFLHTHGVRLSEVTRANLLISHDNAVRLFDVSVVECTENGTPIAEDTRDGELPSVGEILRRYCNVESDDLLRFFAEAEEARTTHLPSFGRTLEERFESDAPVSYPPTLSGMSDVGLTRQLNEDNWGWIKLSDRARLYVVADGMGGHDGGEVASALAVKTICEVAYEAEKKRPEGEDAIESLLDHAFQAANNTVKDHADAKGTDMGTTLTCALILNNRIGFLANVGDSRGYLFREGTLHQVSKDHSLVQKMVERGRITAEEARHHPHSNILLRTVGTERDIDIDIFRVELKSGDKVMMCSDGLWGEVEDRDMESILNTYSDPRIAARELVRASHFGGGKDNVTLMLVEIP